MNDLYLTNLSRKQINILKNAYQESFKIDKFKSLVVELLKRSIKQIYRGYDLDYDDVKYRWPDYARRDRLLATFLSKVFHSDNNLIEFRPMPDRNDLEFCANGIDGESGCYVIYAPENKYLTPALAREYHVNYFGEAEQSYEAHSKKYNVSLLQMHTRVRERWLTHYCLKIPIAIIGTQAELTEFNSNSKWLKGNRINNYSYPPKFRYVLEGEFRPLLIYEAFYAAGQFIESMGFEVDILKSQSLEALSDDDKIFVQAMMIFWDSLKNYTKKEAITRFHDLFNQFTKTEYRGYSGFKPTDLASMKHVMIDEFQDISPEIVNWIRSTFKAIKASGMQASLMCVGDDWQSVYSWRGSSPEFSLKYEDTFNSETPHKINMTTNYRCYQDLIDTAESAILAIDKDNRSIKKGIAAKNHFKISDFLSQKKDPAKLYHSLIKTGLIIPDGKKPSNFTQYLRAINYLLDKNDLHNELMLKINTYKIDLDPTVHVVIEIYYSPQHNDSHLDIILKNRKSIELAFPAESPTTPEISVNQSLIMTSEMDDWAIKSKIDEILSIADIIQYDENKPLLLILTRTLRQQDQIKEHLKTYLKKHPSRVKILGTYILNSLAFFFIISLMILNKPSFAETSARGIKANASSVSLLEGIKINDYAGKVNGALTLCNSGNLGFSQIGNSFNDIHIHKISRGDNRSGCCSTQWSIGNFGFKWIFMNSDIHGGRNIICGRFAEVLNFNRYAFIPISPHGYVFFINFREYISPQFLFGSDLRFFNQFPSRIPKESSKDSESNSYSGQPTSEPDHPPFGRRGPASLLIFISGFYLNDRGFSYIYYKRKALGASLVFAGTLLIISSLTLWMCIGIPATWGWWI